MASRIAARARRLPNELFLERGHDPARTALVLGSGRGGTTWLAEAIARRHRSRLVFEPFHPRLGAIGEGARLFLDPAERAPAFERGARRVLSGRARGPYIDGVRVARLPRGRVVKDVHATGLLPWLRANYPEVPVVYVVRHPIATALSRLRAEVFYGVGDYLATPAGRADAEDSPVASWLPLYDRRREDPEPLIRGVAEWCIENVYPLGHIEPDGDGVALALYESAVREPAAELARLDRHCAGALGPVRARGEGGEARAPSATDWRGTAAEARRSGDWERLLGGWRDEVPRPLAERCLRVVAEFGLGGLYGEGAGG
jgi:hypothetical protein